MSEAATTAAAAAGLTDALFIHSRLRKHPGHDHDAGWVLLTATLLTTAVKVNVKVPIKL